MTAEPTSAELRTMFDELVELDGDAQRARLAALSLPHAAQARLDALLAAAAAPASLLQRPVTAVIDDLRDDHDIVLTLVGSTIGPFRLVALLGEGGSSLVFRGERAAGAGVQSVALKLMRSGLYSTDAQRRFRREQAILAQLTHPNIARLVEAGISDAGAPYIAMELVDGLPITDHAQRHGLGTRERLRCFVALCRAVEAAHAALVVHRDLKPSNVLVDTQGRVKVLDFGIASLLDDEDGATRTRSIVLTPEYAAPEQFAGGVVTTATDVYALGVVLGELLTGRRPNAPGWRGATPRTRGDIDAIIATAIAEEPPRRYQSAGALADDVERHLDGRPVAAHPPTRWYRARKFVQRHRGGVAITALLVLGMLASLFVAVLQARRAEGEASRARATRDFLVAVFREAEPAGPRAAPPSVADVTRAALARVDEEQPDSRVRLDLKTQLGSVLRRQGRLPEAIAALRTAGDDGAARFGDADPLVFDARCELGEALIAAGEYDAADALVAALAPVAQRQAAHRRIDYELFALNIATKRGRIEEALARSTAAATLCGATCDEQSQLNIATARAVVLTDLGRHADAAAEFEQSVALARRVHGERHVEVATALNGLAGAYRRLGRLDDAKRIGLEVIAIDDAVLPPVHWRRSIHWNYLGNTYLGLDDERAALDAFQRAVDQSIASSGGEDPSLSLDYTSIGVLQGRLGRNAEADATFRDALARAERGYGAADRITARIRASHAQQLALSGRGDEAVAPMARAIVDLRAQGAKGTSFLFDALRQQARLHVLAGDDAAALVALDEAERVAAPLGQAVREANRLAAVVLRGVALAQLDRAEEARAAIEPALARLDELAVEASVRAEARLVLAGIALREARCGDAVTEAAAAGSLLATRPFVFPYLAEARDRLSGAIAATCPG